MNARSGVGLIDATIEGVAIRRGGKKKWRISILRTGNCTMDVFFSKKNSFFWKRWIEKTRYRGSFTMR